MSDHILAFLDAMAEHGIRIDEPLRADGCLHRYRHVDDRRGKRNVWCKLVIDERPAGIFGDLKRLGSEKIIWKADGAKKMTAADRQALRERLRQQAAERELNQRQSFDAAAVRANAIWDAAAECSEHPYLKKKRVAGAGLRVAEFWTKEWVNPDTGEVTEKKIKNALLIPLRNERKEIRSLQAIFTSDKVLGRDRDFLSGGEKKGLWHTIGKPTEHDGQVTVLIAEGFATGASLASATDLGVVVAFDAGNLVPVAQKVRRVMPNARIVLCADNDAATESPIKNPGVTYATRAAEAVGGIVAIPRFPDGAPPKASDFNDLACLCGSAEVQAQVLAAIAGRPVEADAPEPEPEPEPEVAPQAKRKRKARPEATLDMDSERDSASFFRVLGHDEEKIHVYSHEKSMVVSKSDDRWKNSLLAVAPLEWWEKEFKGDSVQGQGWEKAAVNWLIRLAYRRGYYDPSINRGRGAWVDKGRFVYHFGDHLVVDGEHTELGRVPETTFCYSKRPTMPSVDQVEAMTSQEGLKLLNIAQKFRWQRDASALLLAGWCALAPLGGALRWRPHIWITGGAGSGKTTVIGRYVNILMNGTAMNVAGKTTESGVRGDLKFDALPVLFDESETTNEGDRARISNILTLARSAASESGARTVKGTANGGSVSYLIRSMFCLCSIALGIEMQADFERFSVLTLQPKKRGVSGEAAAQEWKELEAILDTLRADEELPRRLMRRSLELMPITLKNIKTFSAVGAAKFGSQREGDQYGALVAGAWSLVSNKEATPETARKMFDRYDWNEYFENAEDPDNNKALSTILQTLVRAISTDVSIFELICIADGQKPDGVDIERSKAEAILRRHGIVIHNDNGKQVALFAHHPIELLRLLEGTQYHGDLKSHLLQAAGAYKYDKVVSFAGGKSRCVAVPIGHILHVEAPVHRYEPGEELDPPW